MTKHTVIRKTTGLFAAVVAPIALNANVVCVDFDNLPFMQDGTALHPYESILSAIMNTASHDTIKVATGIYGPFDNQGRSYVIVGGYPGGTAADYQAGTGGDFSTPIADPSLTVVDGGGSSIVVLLTRFDEEPFSLVLSNITVSNGAKGIVCDQMVSWPHVENVTISDCIIENNGAPGETSLGGGILLIGNGHRLVHNIIRNNHGGRGAGISGNSGMGDSLLVEGNLIADNTGYDDHCGGVYLGGYAEIRNNIISGNQLQNSYGWGGGVLILGTAYMSGNVIKHNHCPSYGGAVFVDEGGILYMSNELIHDNSTGLEGAAIALDHGDPGSSYAYLTNCTIANNHAAGGLGGNAVFVDVNSFATVTNCILHGNGDDFHITGGSSLTVSYTLTNEPIAGQGNFQADPLFADTANDDYRLRSTVGRYDPTAETWVTDAVHSPAIDAGDPVSPWANEPGPNGGRINLGFDGNTAFASKSNAGTGIPWGTAADDLVEVYPNPAHQTLTVTLASSDDQAGFLRILSALGMEVLATRMSGTITLPDVSRLADGNYLLRITTRNGVTRSRKFVVSKGE